MANETSLEAARSRIQRLIEEIAVLAKAELSSEEFFQKYLERVVSACDAKGGAVWLVGVRAQDQQPEFQLCSQVEFASSLFQSDEGQRTSILKILNEVVKTRRPVIFIPSQGDAGDVAEGLNNRTPYPFLHVPLITKEQTVGVLQVWLQPYVAPNNFAEFVTFLQSLATHVDQHLQSRRLGNLVLETQRLQHLLRFTADIVGTLDALEVARLTANYGRDLVGCERCAVLVKKGDQWRTLAISGQETVERKSAMVKAMTAFVEAHYGDTLKILSKKELLERAESQRTQAAGAELALTRTDAVDLSYFELSHVVSAVIHPLLNAENEVVGALFCESTSEGFFEAGQRQGDSVPSHRMVEWIGSHASRALIAARDYQTLPLLKAARALRHGHEVLTGQRRHRLLLRTGVIAFLVFLFLLWPVQWTVSGDCALSAAQHTTVAPEVDGKVEKVFVDEGDRVTKGQPIAQLDTSRLQMQLEAAIQDKRHFLAEADRNRAAPVLDEAAAQASEMQAASSAANEAKLRQDIASATLRAPMDGVVITKDLKLHAGEYLQAGAAFAEIDSLSNWDLIINTPEKSIGWVEEALDHSGQQGLPVDYLLYAQSSQKLQATLSNRQQISAAASQVESETVLYVTIKSPPIPDDLRSGMRPGLTGKANINLGRHLRIYIWLCKLQRWFQLHPLLEYIP
ncbi:MAG: efflux RND transporter periplasmic adaptor subunit [Chthoniobacteraceae bacterium]